MPIVNDVDDLVALINFSLDPQEIYYTRSIYNVLDLLGDVGGLFEGLRIISYIFISIFTPLSTINYFTPRLFYQIQDDE